MSQWVDTYAPKNLDEYVWSDPTRRAIVEQWVNEKEVPHLLLYGVPGTGKSSLARLILELIGIPPEDIMVINASKYRVVKDLEDEMGDFVSTIAYNFTGLKYVILNEADKLSDTTQGMLRDEFEHYSSVCRFIMTCNRADKISSALKSRCQTFQFDAVDRTEYYTRLIGILSAENIQFDADTLQEYADHCYPDMRKCIGILQQYCVGGVLHPMTDETKTSLNYMGDVLGLMIQGKITEARKVIVEHASPDDYIDVYRFLYENVEAFGNNDKEIAQSLIAIRDAIYRHEIVADKEINLAACLVEIMRIV